MNTASTREKLFIRVGEGSSSCLCIGTLCPAVPYTVLFTVIAGHCSSSSQNDWNVSIDKLTTKDDQIFFRVNSTCEEGERKGIFFQRRRSASAVPAMLRRLRVDLNGRPASLRTIANVCPEHETGNATDSSSVNLSFFLTSTTSVAHRHVSSGSAGPSTPPSRAACLSIGWPASGGSPVSIMIALCTTFLQ